MFGILNLLDGFQLIDFVKENPYRIFYVVLCLVSFVLYRISICLTVNFDAKERQIKHKNLWAVCTFLFGILIPVIYAVVHRKHKKIKKLKSKSVFLVLSIVLIILSYSGGILYNLSNTGEFEHLLVYETEFDEYTTVVYENDKGQKVVYDKMGNAYTFGQYYHSNNFKFYDENGNSYRWTNNIKDALYSEEQDKTFTRDKWNFFINQNGCIYFRIDASELNYNTDYGVHYDDYGNVYYDIDFIGWDKDGNIVFPPILNYSKAIAYADLIK